MTMRTWGMGLLALAGLTSMAVPAPARACGGCLTPPNPTGVPTPVTAHRMAVALSPRDTTLWDQIEYAGRPEDFVWVLPIAGTSTVELADNAFFEALTQTTQITMVAPAPPRTSCSEPCGGVGPSGLASGDARSAFEEGGMSVDVHFQGVVGPYETATLGSEDPEALVTWMRDHGYQVPDAILPTIRFYVARGLNFVVLRLRPNGNDQRMQPVRVTVPGLSTTFPLRMVSAGIQDHVALELFVFAESRIEAANFGNAEVDRTQVSFDWASNAFDYETAFSDALFAGEGAGTNWVSEFAGNSDPSIAGYRSVDPVSGEEHSAADDYAVVARAIDAPYLTRLRTDLQASELDRDLELRMSDGADIGTRIDVTRELNRAPDVSCPTYCETSNGSATGGASMRGTGRLRCSVEGGAGLPSAPLPLGLGLVGLLALRLRRRRA